MWLLVQWMDGSKPNLSYAVVDSDSLPMRPQPRLETGQLIFIQDSEMQTRRAQILKVSDDRQSVEQFKLTLQRQDHQVQNMLTLCMSNFREMKGEDVCVPLDLPLADETIDISSSEEESELNYESPPNFYTNHQHEGVLPTRLQWSCSEPLLPRSQVSQLEARRNNILNATPAPEKIFAGSPLGEQGQENSRRSLDSKIPHKETKKFVTESGTQVVSINPANQQRVMQMFPMKSHEDSDHGSSPSHNRHVLQRHSTYKRTNKVEEHRCKCTLRKERFDSNRPKPETTQPKKTTADKAIQTDNHDKELQENVEQLEAHLKDVYTKFMELMIHLKINVNTSDSNCNSKGKLSSVNNANEVEQTENPICVPNSNEPSKILAEEQSQPNLTEVSFTENKHIEAGNHKEQKDSDGESDCSLTYDSNLLKANQTKFRLWVEKTVIVKDQMQVKNNKSHQLISNTEIHSSAYENQNKDTDSILQKKKKESALNNEHQNEPMQVDLGLEYNFAHNSSGYYHNEKAVEKEEASNVENTRNEFPNKNDVTHVMADNQGNFNFDEIPAAHDYSIQNLEQTILTNGHRYNKTDRHYDDKSNELHNFRQDVSIEDKGNESVSGTELFIPPVRPSTSQAKTVEVRRASAQTTTHCGLPSYVNISEINPLVPIGNGHVVLPAQLLNRINWSSGSVATRQLLQAIFPREVLGTHSLSGRPPPAFPDILPKRKLDPLIIDDIVSEVMKRCGTSKKMIRQIITAKCSDEARLYRIRWQARQSTRQSYPNNFEDQENNPPSNSIDSDSI